MYILEETPGFSVWAALLALFLCCGAGSPIALPAFAGENTWQKLALDGTHIAALVSDPARSSTMYAATSRGFMKSVDGGAAWTSPGRGLPEDSAPGVVAINPRNSKELYAGYDGRGIFKSLDGGETWQAMNTGLPNLAVRCIAINPDEPNLLYAGISGGVAISTSGGQSWHLSSGFKRMINVNALVIDAKNPQNLYAATGGAGVYKSGNGGVSWRDSNEGLSSLSITALHLDPLKPDIVLAGAYHPASPTDMYVGETNGGVFRSLDGGRSWKETTLSIHIFSFAASPAYPDVVYAGAWGGIYRSVDLGATWTDINAGLDNAFPHTLHVTPEAKPPALLAGTTFGLLSYTDAALDALVKNRDGQERGWSRALAGCALAGLAAALLWIKLRGKQKKRHDTQAVW